jgi:hypothetical protein
MIYSIVADATRYIFLIEPCLKSISIYTIPRGLFFAALPPQTIRDSDVDRPSLSASPAAEPQRK